MSLFRPRYADGQRLEIAGVAVRLKVNARARRVSLRLDAARGEVIATAPTARRLADAAAFALERGDWMAGRAAALAAQPTLGANRALTLFGAPCALTPDGRRPKIVWAADRSRASLTGCGHDEVDLQLAARAIRREALAVFEAWARRHCVALGRPLPQVAVIDARTRWGSCTPASPRRAARIRLSWRLALAPSAVADYVVAHECAHLVEANHGPRFWALVHDLVGDPRPHRAWLRAHGAALHRFGGR